MENFLPPTRNLRYRDGLADRRHLTAVLKRKHPLCAVIRLPAHLHITPVVHAEGGLERWSGRYALVVAAVRREGRWLAELHYSQHGGWCCALIVVNDDGSGEGRRSRTIVVKVSAAANARAELRVFRSTSLWERGPCRVPWPC